MAGMVIASDFFFLFSFHLRHGRLCHSLGRIESGFGLLLRSLEEGYIIFHV